MSVITSYKITMADLEECWNFSVGYFLNPKKDVIDRTNYIERGLGGIVDSFMKKLHEIAVREIINENNKTIFSITDFELHSIGKTQGDNRTEPDIIRVFRNGFSEESFNLLKEQLSNLDTQKNTIQNELKKLKEKKSKVPLIKNCNTIEKKYEARNKLTKIKNSIRKTNLEIIKLNEQNQKTKEKLDTFEKKIKPKIYVEIKNIGLGDAWIGPKLKEVQSIESRDNLSKDSIYYVYCRIKDKGDWDNENEKNAGRRSNPLGVFLKSLIDKPNMKKFHDVEDLSIEIQHVMSVKDIEDNGTPFPSGTIIPDPNFFTSPGENNTPFTHEKIQKKIDEGIFCEIDNQNNVLPKVTTVRLREKNDEGKMVNAKWAEYPSSLGDFTVKGNVKIFSDETESHRRFWIKCLTDVIISNNVIGDSDFKKNKIICYKIDRKGRIDKKNVDDIWISIKNKSIMKKFSPSRISEIAKKI
jgi:hypothetical protein